MKKCLIYMCIGALFFLAGCDNRNENRAIKSGYQIYFTNNDETKIVARNYTSKGGKTDQMLKEFLEVLQTPPDSVGYKCAKPDKVTLLDYYVEDEQLNLKFDSSYEEMDNATEVLMRAAYVCTLVQIPGIKLIGFYVDNQPLSDSNGVLIGPMNESNFVENWGGEINTYQKTNLILYFANKEGDKLVKTTKSLTYGSNIPLEKLVVEQLIKGPSEDQKDLQPVMSNETKLLSTTIEDGVCYVNLSENFLKSAGEVKEEVQIYAIVNSLVELSTVNNVQIAINGVSDRNFFENISFKTVFERNLDIIQTQ